MNTDFRNSGFSINRLYDQLERSDLPDPVELADDLIEGLTPVSYQTKRHSYSNYFKVMDQVKEHPEWVQKYPKFTAKLICKAHEIVAFGRSQNASIVQKLKDLLDVLPKISMLIQFKDKEEQLLFDHLMEGIDKHQLHFIHSEINELMEDIRHWLDYAKEYSVEISTQELIVGAMLEYIEIPFTDTKGRTFSPEEKLVVLLPKLRELNEETGLDFSSIFTQYKIPQLLNLVDEFHLKGVLADYLALLPASTKHLDLSGVTQLKEVGDLSRFSRLQTLKLSGCSKLTSLVGIKECANLVSLDLAGCEALRAFNPISRLKKLTILDVSGCSNLKGEVLEVLLRSRKNLENFNLTYSPERKDLEKVVNQFNAVRI